MHRIGMLESEVREIREILVQVKADRDDTETKYVKLTGFVGVKEQMFTNLEKEKNQYREDLKMMTKKYQKEQHENLQMTDRYFGVDVDKL